eukprot:XP_011676336.1 PREDICTED: uncharacterized protein LOC105444166 [Strongylocentrotus purpuratus]
MAATSAILAPTDSERTNDDLVGMITSNNVFLKAINDIVKSSCQKEFVSLLDTIEKLEGRLLELESSIVDKDLKINHLTLKAEQKSSQISALMRTCNDQEQYSRRNCVRFFGVPENKNEDTTAIVCKIAEEKLGIQLHPSAIDRSHRVGAPIKDQASVRDQETSHDTGNAKPSSHDNDKKMRKKRSRPIIVKFVSYQARKSVLVQRRKMKDTGISIHEDLTKHNQRLLYETRNHSKVLKTWTSDGHVVALLPATGGKTVTKGIRDFEDLRTL